MLKLLITFYLGSCFGSFFLATYYRMKNNISLLDNHSKCETCFSIIPWFALFPIFSFLLLKGKCIFCKNKINSNVFLAEIFGGLFFVKFEWLLWLNTHIFICILLLIFLSIEDLTSLHIHSSIVLIPAIFLVKFNFSLVSFIFLCFLAIILFVNLERFYLFKFIGQGDVEIIIFILIIFHFSITIKVVFLSALFALLFFIIFKCKKLPFIPFLTMSLFLCI